MTSVLPFLERAGDTFLPTDAARGFWGPQANLHARVMIGLFAHEIERLFGEPGWTPARLTVDLYCLPDLSPVNVSTRLIRQGGRIKVVEGELFSGGQSVARASCQILRRTEQPEGVIWRSPPWAVPSPEDTPKQHPPPLRGIWEMRPIAPNPALPMPRKTWLRELRPLIAGEAYTPFSRVATGVDFTSPTAHASLTGLEFINSDITLYLHRAPVGEWTGYEVTDHQSADGVAIGHCTLHDIEGAFGFSSCAALAQKRAPKPKAV